MPCSRSGTAKCRRSTIGSMPRSRRAASARSVHAQSNCDGSRATTWNGTPYRTWVIPRPAIRSKIFLEPPPVVREEKLVAADPTSNDRRGAFDARGDEEVHDGMALIRRQVTMALTNNGSEAHGRLPVT